MKADIIAGWITPEEKIGVLNVNNVHGKEIVSVELDKKWLKDHNVLLLDPDVMSYRGIQYPISGKGIFGFLSDASPDRWGRRLLDREENVRAEKEKRPARKLLEMDYLLGISDELRYGGIRFKDSLSGNYLSNEKFKIPPMTDVRMLEAASRGYELSDEDEKALQLLVQPGSSLGGARPKSNVKDVDGSLWIAKFPSKNDEFDIGAWEMTEHDLAEKCDINVPDAKLMKLSEYGSTFFSKRFDRNISKRIHLMSAMTALGKTDGHTDGVSSFLPFRRRGSCSTHVAFSCTKCISFRGSEAPSRLSESLRTASPNTGTAD